jgi:predicted anti-sigma-YlaC factor YlaD
MPNRAECEAVVRQLWPFLDGAVTESQRELIAVHLEECVACASHFEFAREFLAAVAAARPHLAPNAALHARVLAALGTEGFTLHGPSQPS